MNYLLGIDFGGGASKATLIDTQGNIVAENTEKYRKIFAVYKQIHDALAPVYQERSL